MSEHTDNENTNNENDVRRLAGEQLSYLAVLQFQHRRRSGRGEPWRDPRHGQGRVLALLKLKPEMAQRELTYLMGMSRQSIAELLGKLEKQDLVEREPSPENRRAVIVRLTDKGRETSQGDGRAAGGIAGILECLSDEEVANLSEYLGRIIERIEQESGEDAGQRREMIERFWQARRDDPRWHDDPHRRGGPGFGPGWGPMGPGSEPGGAPVPPAGGPEGFGPHGPEHFGPGHHAPHHHGLHHHGPGGGHMPPPDPPEEFGPGEFGPGEFGRGDFEPGGRGHHHPHRPPFPPAPPEGPGEGYSPDSPGSPESPRNRDEG